MAGFFIENNLIFIAFISNSFCIFGFTNLKDAKWN